MKISYLLQLLLLLDRSLGRPLVQNFEVLKSRRSLLQFEDNCTIGSNQILEEYPSFVSLQDALDGEDPNRYTNCGGVLLTTDTVLTSAGCIWSTAADGMIPYNLDIENHVNRTIDREFLVVVSPFCTHGNSSEVLQVLRYHFMEDFYEGFPKNGYAVAVLELKSNVTSLNDSELAPLRITPLPLNSTLILVGHGATNTTHEEINSHSKNSSTPEKIINFQTISDQQCEQFLNNLKENKSLDGVTESCAVVMDEYQDNVCNADDGSPLFDTNGNIAGVLTWWSINQCGRVRDQTMPIVFTDVTKQKVQDFIKQVETEALYLPPNVTDGVGESTVEYIVEWRDTLNKLSKRFGVKLQDILNANPEIKNKDKIYVAQRIKIPLLPNRQSYAQSNLLLLNQGCDEQTLKDAPWAVPIQLRQTDDPTEFHHLCGGVLFDKGTKILTIASCIWDNTFPSQTSTQTNSSGQSAWDMREFQKPYQGNIQFPIFAALAPKCRYFTGEEPRNELTTYVIHPNYNGNPQEGNNIVILGLKEQFPPESSFPNFQETLERIGNPSPTDFPIFPYISNVTFYSWGAELRSEALEDERGVFKNQYPTRKIPMKLASDEDCEKVIPSQGASKVYNRMSEICTYQPGPNYTNICTNDNGGPLVGNDQASNNQLVLLGLKTQLQYRQCQDGPGSYEVFTDVLEMKEFILSVLKPEDKIQKSDLFPPPPVNNNSNKTKIIIIVVIVSVLFIIILTIVFIFYKHKFYQNQNKTKRMWYLASFKLNKEIQNIHFMLANIAQKNRNPDTGKARRHSDLAASLEFLLAQGKVQNQIAGYTMFAPDDSVLNAARGAAPQYPFLLAVMNKYQGVSANENNQLQIQRVLDEGQNEQIQKRIELSMVMKFRGDLVSFNNSGGGLILPDTPTREDFNMMIEFEELEIGERLGTGAFGSVYRAFWLTKNMNVAVKIVHAHILEQLMDYLGQGGSYLNSIVGELGLLSRIDSPYIVRCFGGCLKPPNICLVLEYMPKGSLDSFIHNYNGSIPIGLIMRVAQGIAQGLDALHPTVVHRDLKPQNILLDDSYQVKIADFGMSKLKEGTYLSETMVKGTPAYIAPEAFKGENIDEKSDIYALGLIMWEMISKEHPWQDCSLPVQIMAQVVIYGERPPIPTTCPSELKKLIQRCWEANPRERPTAREVATKLTILRFKLTSKSQKPKDDSANMKHFELLSKNTNKGQSVGNEEAFDLNFTYSQFSLHSFTSQEQE